MRVGVDIDHTLTAYPKLFRNAIELFSSVLLTSKIKEVGSRENNFKYRVNQLRKLNINGGKFDALVIVEGEDPKEKAKVCNIFDIDVVFDSNEDCLEELSKASLTIKV